MQTQPSSGGEARDAAALAVFTPSLILTVTIERGADDEPELHIHPGGQGFWIARMAAAIGARVELCAPVGGETGRVLIALLEAEDVELSGASVSGANGCYVHDRRGGEREPIVDVPGAALSRHEADDLYGKALVAALATGLLVLTGPQHPAVLQPDVYRRLAADAAANDVAVVADLTGEPLEGALAGYVTVLKVSGEDLHEQGLAASERTADLVAAGTALHERGARNVLISRASEGALLLTEDGWFETAGPSVTPADYRGTGDSMTATTATGLARGLSLHDAVRLGVAAGTINASRHGLGTGHRPEVEQLADQIQVRQLAGDGVP